jgi:hypothetical protein
MAEKQIAKSNPKKAPYIAPTIRTFDVSELPEKWINALRSTGQLRLPALEEIEARQSKAKAALENG